MIENTEQVKVNVGDFALSDGTQCKFLRNNINEAWELENDEKVMKRMWKRKKQEFEVRKKKKRNT